MKNEMQLVNLKLMGKWLNRNASAFIHERFVEDDLK